MSKTLSLDDLRQQIETSYGPLVIDLGGGRTVRLLPALRLPRERRALMTEAFNEMSGHDETGDLNAMVDKLSAALRTVCEDDAAADRLLEAVGDDGQLMNEIFKEYQEATGLGDRSPSDSSSTTSEPTLSE